MSQDYKEIIKKGKKSIPLLDIVRQIDLEDILKENNIKYLKSITISRKIKYIRYTIV